MCKETDADPGVGEKTKNSAPTKLPEAGKPYPIPKEAIIPPSHDTSLNRKEDTIAHDDVFTDKDLSSISAEA